jgi:hypothetical protein
MLRRTRFVRKKLKEIARLEEIRASSKCNLNEDELTKLSFAAALVVVTGPFIKKFPCNHIGRVCVCVYYCST